MKEYFPLRVLDPIKKHRGVEKLVSELGPIGDYIEPYLAMLTHSAKLYLNTDSNSAAQREVAEKLKLQLQYYQMGVKPARVWKSFLVMENRVLTGLQQMNIPKHKGRPYVRPGALKDIVKMKWRVCEWAWLGCVAASGLSLLVFL